MAHRGLQRITVLSPISPSSRTSAARCDGDCEQADVDAGAAGDRGDDERVLHPSSPVERSPPRDFLLVAALLLFSPMSFWVRPDPIETLLVAGAVVSTPSRRRSIWVGICLGLAVNLKPS